MSNQPTPIPANAAAMTALANQVILARLARYVVTGTTSKGRTMVTLTGSPSPAEVEWENLRSARCDTGLSQVS